MKTTLKALLALSALLSFTAQADDLVMTSNLKPSKHTRDNWYIEFALYPGGEMHVDHDNSKYGKKVKADTRFGAQFGAGATVNQNLLLGGEINSFVLMKETKHSAFSRTESSISNTNLMAVATLFPWEEGFFFRGGLGFAATSLEYKDKLLGIELKDTQSINGYALAVGTGYAWWIGKTFNMSAKLDYNYSFYNNKKLFGDKINAVSYWSAGLGFHWF